jgi:hypothetical protein
VKRGCDERVLFFSNVMPNKVGIAGLNKVDLLHALWYVAPARSNCPFSFENAAAAVTGYIDVYCGRRLGIDISKDKASPSTYDRNFGHDGVFKNVVRAFREGQRGARSLESESGSDSRKHS